MKRYSIMLRTLTLAIAGVMLPELALAAGTGLSEVIGGGLCDVVSNLTGPVGQALATLAVLMLGMGAFFGKVNWGLAVLFAVGIAAIFGAAAIVSTIGGATGCGT